MNGICKSSQSGAAYNSDQRLLKACWQAGAEVGDRLVGALKCGLLWHVEDVYTGSSHRKNEQSCSRQLLPGAESFGFIGWLGGVRSNLCSSGDVYYIAYLLYSSGVARAILSVTWW